MESTVTRTDLISIASRDRGAVKVKSRGLLLAVKDVYSKCFLIFNRKFKIINAPRTLEK